MDSTETPHSTIWSPAQKKRRRATIAERSVYGHLSQEIFQISIRGARKHFRVIYARVYTLTSAKVIVFRDNSNVFRAFVATW